MTFTSIFPACYDGRWPHIHFEVYPSLATATDGANKIATSQIALPEDVSRWCTRPSGYEQSVRNLSKVSLAGDNVFGDGYDLQIPTMTGDPTKGYTLTSRARCDPEWRRASAICRGSCAFAEWAGGSVCLRHVPRQRPSARRERGPLTHSRGVGARR